MKIVQVNDNDLFGRVFNGYDIAKHFNNAGKHSVKQIVINKFSSDDNVIPLFKDAAGTDFEYDLHNAEKEILSVQSQISATSYFLGKNEYYKQADVAHYHQLHNAKLSLKMFADMAKTKPTVMSFHDPWPLTGRCVHPGKCEKWKNGCKNCEYLNTLFDFTKDNCNSLWKVKKQTFEEADIDIIVYSQFMLNMVKENPYTKNLNVHLVNFGIDLSKYEFSCSKAQARKKLELPKDSIVLFFRSQRELKGTNYIVEALKKLETDKQIVLLSCDQRGLLEELRGKYKIVEFGALDQEKMKLCYNACDIFLMPSLGESFGMMAVEAMASGRPVVVFNNTALPFVTFAPECGVLVNDRDSDDLHDKIKMLIDDPVQREARGELGKRLAKENYSLEAYYQQLDEVYQKAFERQKYKLSVNYTPDYAFDSQDQEVQKLLLGLKQVAEQVFVNIEDFKTLKNVNYLLAKSSDEIDYSNKNVQNALAAFNIEASKKIEEIDDRFFAINNRSFRKLKLYKKLKKSALLGKIIRLIKRVTVDKNAERFDALVLELNKIQAQNKELEERIQQLTELVKKNEKQP